ncbi:MAG TPA: hypothetical protein VHA56_16990 [Mucilaginibacter sp.]|nr:hypothetical protein [Mucilaginibacter sp.]
MRFFLLFICVATAINGCEKGGINPSNLTGKWELRHYSGTIAGVSKDLPAGNGTMLQFNADSTYKHFTDFKQDNQGSYHISPKGVLFGGVRYDGISFDDRTTKDFIVLKADSLTIGNTFPDGVTSLYIRKSN